VKRGKGETKIKGTAQEHECGQKKRFGTDPDTRMSTCDIIKKHHEILKEDPERLSSDFIQKII
jgi:hypothetical protein